MTVLHMDCRAGMAMFPDNTFDSIVTDPPYELGFMGKSWDSTGIAYDVDMRCEALRVLKPGGHLLSFSGSRTYHRMTCAIEDAGFEIRDQIMWIYGSGFPKSLDVSKAIDKTGGASVAWFGPWFRAWREGRGVTQKHVAALFPSRTGGLTGCVANWELGLNMPTPEQFNLIRDTFALPFESIEAAQREVIGQRTTGIGTGGGSVAIMGDGSRDITAAGSDAARQWEGWGTALKPAHEPICVARKPLIGTVAANVLAHGCGAINIDGCRVAGTWAPKGEQTGLGGVKFFDGSAAMVDKSPHDLGRWPANLIHDGNVPFPDAKGQQGETAERQRGTVYGAVSPGTAHVPPRIELDTSAARFFYCAKASKADRNSGLDGLVCVILEWNNSLDGEIKWGVEARQVKLLVDTEQFPPKVIAAFGAGNKNATEWNTMLCGKITTAPFRTGSTSTTATRTSLTTPSAILNYFRSCITSGSIPDANCETASGGSPAENAASCSTSVVTTCAWMASALGVSPAASPLQLKLSASAAVSGHPTVKPHDLMRYLLRLVTPPGGVTFDPFAGSGSTFKAARAEGFDFIGFELQAEYVAIANARGRLTV